MGAQSAGCAEGEDQETLVREDPQGAKITEDAVCGMFWEPVVFHRCAPKAGFFFFLLQIAAIL